MDFGVAASRMEDKSMDRRAFITQALLSTGFLAVTAGAASALPALPPTTASRRPTISKMFGGAVGGRPSVGMAAALGWRRRW